MERNQLTYVTLVLNLSLNESELKEARRKVTQEATLNALIVG